MTNLSQKLYEEACKLMPGGVNSPVRACGNVHAMPLFIDKAKGSRIWDVDGREYIDFVLSWGPMLLGHACPDVEEALLKAVKKGTSFGAPCPAEVELAKLVSQAMPCMEMVRMVNSGTEATMSAIRLARGITGRTKILKFKGCYHGHADAFLVAAGSGLATFSISGSPGVPDAIAKDTLAIDYNNANDVAICFEKYGNEIAAVIVEPVAANMGLVLPEPDFLKNLRDITTSYGSLLIFDEVITGFRLDYGGAQKRFSIKPDLTTLGKIMGGGLPVACFGGRREFMEHIAPRGNIYQAGTLSGNPLAMAAGIATLKKLAQMDYNALEKRTLAFAKELEDILKNKCAKIKIPAIASMFSIFFSEKMPENFEDVKKADQNLYEQFFKQMRSQGIYLAPSPFETAMLSFAHTDEDFKNTLKAAEKIKFE